MVMHTNIRLLLIFLMSNFPVTFINRHYLYVDGGSAALALLLVLILKRYVYLGQRTKA